MSACRALLDRRIPGSRRAIAAHIRRSEYMCRLVRGRWTDVNRVQQWQAKHARWVIEVGLADRADSTRYRYYLTIRACAKALNRWENWQRFLDGPWSAPP